MKRVNIFGLFLLMFFGLVIKTEAAVLYMDPNQSELKRGDTTVVSLRINTDPEECINAVDATIRYSDNIEPVDTSRGKSILSIWLEEPIIDKANRTITFAGGVPNGYCGRIAGDPRLTNNLLDILFMSPGLQIGSTASGNEVDIVYGDETRVLLNDGFGTEASRQLFGSKISLSKEAGSRVDNVWLDAINNDTQPPEDFTINLEQTPNAFSNKYFITFNTTDKQSGIAYYEVMEEPSEFRNRFIWGAATAPWVKATSPYVLKDQSLNITIRVRAIDKAGNEYVAVLVPGEEQRTLPQELMIVAVVFGVGLLIVVIVITTVVILGRRRKQENTEFADDEDNYSEEE